MKTLYISDLDGTLLRGNVELSGFTINVLKEFIKAGNYFTVATARTEGSVMKIVEEIPTNVPAILMNGVSVFDLVQKKYYDTQEIEKDSVKRLLDILKEYNLTGFLYTIDDNVQQTYYENLDAPNRSDFVKERVERYQKRFTQVNSFEECLHETVVYFSVLDKKDVLAPVYDKLIQDEKINVEFYRDVYSDDYWYLEVCSGGASKFHGINKLKEMYEFDKVVCFGDNLNDIPMFLASDEGYAVANAKDKLKAHATGIIKSNEEDGVAKFLQEIM